MVRRLRFLLERFFHRDRLDRSMDEEIRLHIAERAEELQRQGVPASEALRRARLEFGGMEKYKEQCRETRRFHLLHDFVDDLRYGMRSLRKAPAFSIVAILTLALGIGANSAIFSVIHSALLKPLPVADASKLRMVDWSVLDWQWPESFDMTGHMDRDSAGRVVYDSFSLPAFEDFRSHSRLFSTLFAFSPPRGANAAGAMTTAQLVSGDFFNELGLRPAIGRLFTEDDDRVGSAQVAVISHDFWREHFDSDPNIDGRTLILNTQPLTIIGVAPRGFFGVQPGIQIGVYAPLHEEAEINLMGDPRAQNGGPPFCFRPTVFWVQLMGRLAPGVRNQQAEAELNGIFRHQLVALGAPDLDSGHSPRIGIRSGNRGLDEIQENFAPPLVILAWVVGIVLLIACGNVANLLLVRGAARSREIAVRLSLGAGRLRIARQLLTESLLLSFLGAGFGLVFAVWTSRLLLSLLSPPESRLTLTAQIDSSVLGFSVLVAILTAVVFGVVPAFRSGRVELTSALKTAGVSSLGKPESRLSKALVTVQVTLSVLLLVGAGLFVRTLSNLRNSELGFEPNHLLLFGVDPMLNGYRDQRLRDLFDQITARVRLIPGVRSVAFVHHTVVSGSLSGGLVRTDLPNSSTKQMNAMFNVVGMDYFQTMGLRLVLGRNFQETDTATSQPAAVISKQLAMKLFGDASPIGQTLHTGRAVYKLDYQIVGVVNDAKYGGMKKSPPTYYAFYRQMPDRMMEGPHFAVRTQGNPRAVVAAVRHAISQIDAQLPIHNVITQNEEIDVSLRQERLFADLTSMFGILALLLACVGLYGIMAYSVWRRTQEIGIRMALGADRSSVSTMVLREAMRMVLLGVALGIPAAMGLSRLIARLLWNVRPFDPQTLVSSAAVMMTVALIATAIPARRATRIDPIQALRCE